MAYNAVPGLDPVTKRMHPSVEGALATEVVAPAAAAAAAVKVDKGALVFSVRDYGAAGNWSAGTSGTDDTAAINAALTAAAAAAAAGSCAARVQFPWTLGNGYKTTAAVAVPDGVELDMRAPIVYCGSGGETALTVGTGTQRRRQRHRIMARRYALTDWASETDKGVVLRNFYNCSFEIVQCDFFTVGLTCIGDSGLGFSYNDIRLGSLQDNKIAIDLTNDTAGWCNENDFYGGRFVVASSTYTTQDRVGVRITSRATSKYYNNANVFWKPSFELKGLSISGVSRCALIEYGTANSFNKCRHESNSGGVLEQLNDSNSNEISFTYSDLGANYPTLVNNSNSSAGRVRLLYRMMTEDAMRPLRKVDGIHKRACYYDGSSAVNLPGLTVGTSATGNTDARAASSITIASDYVEIPSSRYAGFYMSTRALKRFAVFRDCEANYGGRIMIRCYDSGGTIISSGQPIVTSKVAANPAYTTSYGGTWRLGSDSTEPYDFQVTSSVDYVFIGVIGGTAPCRIRSLAVCTVDTGDAATWLAFPDDGINYGVASPTAGTWEAGRAIRNAAPSVGGAAMWVCTAAGSPGTWTTVQAGPSGAAADVQVFAASGTWAKPAGASTVECLVVGGGAGGGSGRRGAAGTVRCGGGGGGGGGLSMRTLPAVACGSTETITVGAGGAGGAAVTANDTNGNAGSSGGASSFGAHARTVAPTGGGGGTNAAGTAGQGSTAAFAGGAGGAASGSGAAGSAPTLPPNAASGGGSGGGITTGDAASAGGAGATVGSITRTASAGGAIDAAATPAADSPSSSGEPGYGGGGGGSSITTAAGAGANGGLYGGGGGGGGASLNGNNSGKGGDGAAGIVIVITRF